MNDIEKSADGLFRSLNALARWPLTLVVGAAVLGGMRLSQDWLDRAGRRAYADAEAAAVAVDDLGQELAERQALRDVVAGDLTRAKNNAANLTKSRKVLFEGGLAVSEEKRLLEKQWEIMTTYLLVDSANDKVQIMRGEQALETWPMAGGKPKTVGPGKALPRMATIISKERFAHPERGKSEQVEGRLDWEPPQVGTSARARALGENVLFTHEGLIIHGPPLDKKEHDAYAHECLSLPAPTARRIYQKSFIGTRVLIQ
jgi:hypothetical protein